jgi:hypothetical protein
VVLAPGQLTDAGAFGLEWHRNPLIHRQYASSQSFPRRSATKNPTSPSTVDDE